MFHGYKAERFNVKAAGTFGSKSAAVITTHQFCI